MQRMMAWGVVGVMMAAMGVGGMAEARGAAGDGARAGGVYARWTNGPSHRDDYFPLAVWLQDPAYAAQWKKAGINLYIGLWKGPTIKQLDALRAAGMQTICEQNEVALKYDKTLPDGRPVIVGWLLPDEPDNAQSNGKGGYGPPTRPGEIQALADRYRKRDGSRPVLLGLGQGIAWDAMTWRGQGGKIVPEHDYPQYLKACDIAAFDVYPVASDSAEIHGKLWRVALGVDRLKRFAPPGTIIWNHIETGDIGARGPDHTPSPAQIKAEVWMSIIHGSRGIDYFIHGKSSAGKFDHLALMRPEHAGQLAALAAMNRQIQQLAAVINSPATADAVSVSSADGETDVDIMARHHGGALYIFAVAMREKPVTKTLMIGNATNATGVVEVIGEGRTLHLTNGRFTDAFEGYGVHLYRIGGGK